MIFSSQKTAKKTILGKKSQKMQKNTKNHKKNKKKTILRKKMKITKIRNSA